MVAAGLFAVSQSAKGLVLCQVGQSLLGSVPAELRAAVIASACLDSVPRGCQYFEGRLHAAEPIKFENDDEDKDLDENFLKLLQESTTGTTKGEKGKTKLHELDLEEENVAKVLPLVKKMSLA